MSIAWLSETWRHNYKEKYAYLDVHLEAVKAYGHVMQSNQAWKQ